MLSKILQYLGFSIDSRFYYLSLMYENNEWVIHGLWPQLSKTDYPQFCKKVDFNPDLLNPIINDLDKVWYSNRGNNDDFWEHEWKKHGSCVFTKMNEFEYFSKALELYKFVRDSNIIDKYKINDKALIPFNLNFKLIE